MERRSMISRDDESNDYVKNRSVVFDHLVAVDTLTKDNVTILDFRLLVEF